MTVKLESLNEDRMAVMRAQTKFAIKALFAFFVLSNILVHRSYADNIGSIPESGDIDFPVEATYTEKVLAYAAQLNEILRYNHSMIVATNESKTEEEYISNYRKWVESNGLLWWYSGNMRYAVILAEKGYINLESGSFCYYGGSCNSVYPKFAMLVISAQATAELAKIAGVTTEAHRLVSNAIDDDDPGTGIEPNAPPTKTCGNVHIYINGSDDICVIFDFLADKPIDVISLGFVPMIRDAFIKPEDNGDIARLIRDPGRTIIEFVADIFRF